MNSLNSLQGTLASSLRPSLWGSTLVLPHPHNDCMVWPTPQNKNEVSSILGEKERSPHPSSSLSFHLSSCPFAKVIIGDRELGDLFIHLFNKRSTPSSYQHDVQYFYQLKIFPLQGTENPSQTSFSSRNVLIHITEK